MSSLAVGNSMPHAVCIPMPFQSHIKAMLQLAQLLHHRGFHITFVNTEFNHKRFLKSIGPNYLDRLPNFRFETIPDGLPSSDENDTQDNILLIDSVRKHCLAPFRNLLNKLNGNMDLPVTSIVSDGFLTFTITVAEELGIPIAQFFTLAAVGFMSIKIFPTLVEKGFSPLKDESCLTNGFLDKVIDWVPGVKDIRLRDLPRSWRNTNPDDIMFNFCLEAVEGAHKASAVVVHTFEALEPDVLDALSSTTSMLPPVYAIGPLQLLLNQIPEHPLKSVGYSLWKEETECLQWLNDGLPCSDEDDTQDLTLLCDSIRRNCLAPFRDLLNKLNDTPTSNNPPVSCIVSDGFMTFTITAAQELGIPIALFFTIAACGFLGSKQYSVLVEKGLAPLKDESCFTNGFLDKVVDWIPGMKGICLRDLPSCFRTTNPDDIFFNFSMEAMDRVHKASAVVVHTFDALEPDVLDALSSMPPPVYAIGPLQLLVNQIPEHPLKSGGYSLWKEETDIQWLNSKAPNAVIYVNFGSLVVITPEHLVEFGWGLANSKLPFFWVIRPDLVIGDSAILPPEFVAETKGRSLIASWCPQEQVLNHPSVGGFLTHSGWNSTIESLSAGVPMLCWPINAEQQTNCFYTCNDWGSGMEIENNVKRGNVEKLVRELMEGDEGKKMKEKAMEWKKLADEATAPHGSSSTNLNILVNQVLLRNN